MTYFGISTWPETEMLRRYASQAKLGVVEIGIFDGGNTANMALVAKVPVYGIDPFIPDSMPPHNTGNKDTVLRNLSFYNKFRLFEDYSYNVVKTWTYPFDFLFIDGSHIYEDVKRDFDDWFPLLADGGYVAIHDAGPVTSVQPSPFAGWPGPIQLVQELSEKYPIIDGIDSLRILRK